MTKRKGRRKKSGEYFGQNEEEYVVKFLSCEDDSERSIIFNNHLKEPLDKMIESIIRKYKLYRKTESFEDLHKDTMSFLITKANKFEPGRNKKAYSYYGTIVKRYVIGLLINDDKRMKHNLSYEDVKENLEERQDLSYEMNDESFSNEFFIPNLKENIEEFIKNDEFLIKNKLTENEKNVGKALIEILDNWEQIFEDMNGGVKYNKNAILETLRNYTNLNTKDIRNAMKRFIKLYKTVKNSKL